MFLKFYELETLSEHEPLSGFRVKFIHSERMTFAYWQITEGAVLPEHSHEHEQVAHLLQGMFQITIDGESKDLDAGSIAVIPSGALHSGIALTNCAILDAFAPVREDYFQKFK